jgi:hypothetical protein
MDAADQGAAHGSAALPATINRAMRRRLGRLLTLARRRAKRDGIPCTVTADDLVAMLDRDPYCRLTGELLTVKNVSLDQFIPRRGYTTANVQLVTLAANRSKQDRLMVRYVDDNGVAHLVLLDSPRGEQYLAGLTDSAAIELLTRAVDERAARLRARHRRIPGCGGRGHRKGKKVAAASKPAATWTARTVPTKRPAEQLTLAEIAKLTGRTRQAVSKWVHEGVIVRGEPVCLIPAAAPGGRGSVTRITPEAFRAFVASTKEKLDLRYPEEVSDDAVQHAGDGSDDRPKRGRSATVVERRGAERPAAGDARHPAGDQTPRQAVLRPRDVRDVPQARGDRAGLTAAANTTSGKEKFAREQPNSSSDLSDTNSLAPLQQPPISSGFRAISASNTPPAAATRTGREQPPQPPAAPHPVTPSTRATS